MKGIRTGIFLLVLVTSLGLMANSCNFYDDTPKTYISVHLINRTNENIVVYTGDNILFLILPSAILAPGSSQSVTVEQGGSVSFYGQSTDTFYGSRSFYFDTQWEIY